MSLRSGEPPLGEDGQLAVRDVLMRFEKALRARRLYADGSDIGARFQEEFVESLLGFLAERGELGLRVRPTAFDRADTPVTAQGLDELALSLFRQGIIALRFLPALERDELTRFVSAVATGLSALDGHDDLVTLLWRADLRAIEHASVLGYEETGGVDQLWLDSGAVGATLDELLPGGDEALAALDRKRQREQSHGELGAELEALRNQVAGEGPVALSAAVLETVRELCASPDAPDHYSGEDLEELLAVTARWLLAECDVANLAGLASLLAPAGGAEIDLRFAAAIERFVRAGIDDASLMALVRTLPDGARAHADALATVLGTFARDRRELVLSLWDEQHHAEDRAAIGRALVKLAQNDPELLVARFRATAGERARELLSLIDEVNRDVARKALSVRLSAADPGTQRALLAALSERSGLYDARVRAALFRLAQAQARLRGPVADTFCTLGDRDAAEGVWPWIQQLAESGADPELLTSLLRAVARLGDDERLLGFSRETLERRALLKRKALGDLKVLVVRALGSSDSAGARELLVEHTRSSEDGLREAAELALGEIARRERDRERVSGAREAREK